MHAAILCVDRLHGKCQNELSIFFEKLINSKEREWLPSVRTLGAMKNLCQLSNVEEAVIWEHSTAIAIWVMIGRDLRHLHIDVRVEGHS